MSVTRHLVQAAIAACMLPDKLKKLEGQNKILLAQNDRLRDRAVELVEEANETAEVLCKLTEKHTTLLERLEIDGSTDATRLEVSQYASIRKLTSTLGALRIDVDSINEERLEAITKYQRLAKASTDFSRNIRTKVVDLEALNRNQRMTIGKLKGKINQPIDTQNEINRLRNRLDASRKAVANITADLDSVRHANAALRRTINQLTPERDQAVKARDSWRDKFRTHAAALEKQRDNLVAKKERQADALTTLHTRVDQLKRQRDHAEQIVKNYAIRDRVSADVVEENAKLHKLFEMLRVNAVTADTIWDHRGTCLTLKYRIYGNDIKKLRPFVSHRHDADELRKNVLKAMKL